MTSKIAANLRIVFFWSPGKYLDKTEICLGSRYSTPLFMIFMSLLTEPAIMWKYRRFSNSALKSKTPLPFVAN